MRFLSFFDNHDHEEWVKYHLVADASKAIWYIILAKSIQQNFLMTILQFFSDYSLLCVGNLKANFITQKKKQILQ